MITALSIVVYSILSLFILNFVAERLTEYQPLSLVTSDEEQPAFNFLFRVFAPNILLLAFGMLSYLIHGWIDIRSLWLIVPVQAIIRILYNYDRLRIFNWPRFVIATAMSSILAFWIGKRVLANEDLLFPEIQDMEKELWLVVILYLYIILNTVLANNQRNRIRLDKFINHSYRTMRERFGDQIQKHQLPVDFENFIYAVMICESFNHPLGDRLTRKLTAIYKVWTKEGLTVANNRAHILKRQKIDLAIAHIKEIYQNVLQETVKANRESDQPFDPQSSVHMSRVWHRIAWFYSRDNNHATEVCRVYDALSNPSSQASTLTNAEMDRLRLNAFYSEGL